MTKAQRDILRKKRVLEHAERIGNIRKTSRYFGVSRSGFYRWKLACETYGDEGLVNKKPCPVNLKLRTAPEIVEKVLYLRRTYHLGPIRIVWYPERYHGMKVSDAGVYLLAQRRELPGFKVPGAWRFQRNDIEQWIERQKKANGAREVAQ